MAVWWQIIRTGSILLTEGKDLPSKTLSSLRYHLSHSWGALLHEDPYGKGAKRPRHP